MICAYTAINTLNSLNKKWNLALTSEIYSRGFKKTKWQGRLEIVSDDPLIVIDGCHNLDGVQRVCEFVSKLNYHFKRAVISISADKDKEKMLSILNKSFDELVFTRYTYSRSASEEDLYQLSNHQNKKMIPSVDDAIKYCIENKCEFTLFLGSLYLASEVRNIMKPL